MCEVTTYNAQTHLQVNRYDPTRTTTLRNAFVRASNRRFRELIAVIRKAVVEKDGFRLRAPTTLQLDPPISGQFGFPRTADKVQKFMQWLQQQENKGLLETREMYRYGSSVDPVWTNRYIWDSYKRGVIRARYELNRAGYTVPTIDQSGGIEAIMSTPFHVDRVGLVFTRAFEQLKNITSQMDTQISQVLAQGLVDGDNPRLLARKMVAVIDGAKAGELGITDTLGRYIPARRRAEILARTEVIRAHHAANMQEYKNWGAEGFEVVAEWVTAGDDRVCTECASYSGDRYTLKAMEYAIPVHPQCRCIAIPVSQTAVPTAELKTEFTRNR